MKNNKGEIYEEAKVMAEMISELPAEERLKLHGVIIGVHLAYVSKEEKESLKNGA